MCCEEQDEGLSKDQLGCDAVVNLLLLQTELAASAFDR